MEMINEILAYITIKHNFVWEHIYEALKNKEEVDMDDAWNTCNNIKYDYKTIIHDDYPSYLTNVIRPPFILFFKGSYSFLEHDGIVIKGQLNKNNLKFVKECLRHNHMPCFLYEDQTKETLSVIYDSGISCIFYTKNICKCLCDKWIERILLKKNTLVVSEVFNKDCETDNNVNRILVSSNRPILSLGKNFIEDISFMKYVIKNNMNLFVTEWNDSEMQKYDFLKLHKIRKVSDLNIVFINKN